MIQPAKSTNLTAGIVLAGGLSRRTGQDKSRLPFGGTTLLQWVIRRVALACQPVIVVARAASDYSDCGTRVIADQRPGDGPLAGLAAGLAAVETAYAAVVPCDAPLIEPALLQGLSGLAPEWDVVVPVVGGREQPLCAVYSRAVRAVADAMLQRGERALQALLTQPGVRVRRVSEEEVDTWDPGRHSFVNINTPEDYERARDMLTRSAPA